MNKKDNAFLNFIWFDKKQTAKNIIAVLSVMLILIALAVGYINSKLELMVTGDDVTTVINTAVRDEPDVTDETEPSEEEDVNDEEIDKVVSKTGRQYLYDWAHNDIQPMKSDYVINVLLIGLDSRTGLKYGGRSDTLILLSLNKQTKKINK